MLLHSDTLFWFRANQSLLFLLNDACLAEKQQISTTLEANTLTITPPMRFSSSYITSGIRRVTLDKNPQFMKYEKL